MSNTLKSSWLEDAYYTRTVTTACLVVWLRVERLVKPMRRHAGNLSMLAFVGVASGYILFPSVANADFEAQAVRLQEDVVALIIDAMQNQTEPFGRLPVSADAAPRRQFTVPITAYSSDPWQTDDTPCVTASGLDVCERNIENVVAANFLPLGTRVRIPELYGDRVFYVEDRMNARYHYKMDIWMQEIAAAKEFGVQYATVEVF